VTLLQADAGHGDEPAVRFTVSATQVASAARALHQALVAPPPTVDVVVAGARGLVGRSLLRQAAERALDGVSLRSSACSGASAPPSRPRHPPLAAEAALEDGEAVPWRRALERARTGRTAPRSWSTARRARSWPPSTAG